MKPSHTFSAVMTVGVLTAILASEYLTAALPDNRAGQLLYTTAAILRGRNPPSKRWDIIRNQTTGYYENLLSAGREWDGRTLLEWVRDPRGRSSRETPVDPYARGGFLRYEPKASIEFVSEKDPKELFTNSFGLADQEYAAEKPAGTRRVAWIGDSLSRGYGVGIAERFESRLEQRLNEQARSPGGQSFEILNFGVDGYRGTQLCYVGIEKAPAFRPDVYILALTELSVAPNWGAHLAQLVHDGEDVRFDFLRDIVETSRLQPNDPAAVVEAKLTPYRLSVLREILGQIKSNAERQGAEFMVVLLPAVEDQRTIEWRFEGIRELVGEMHIPVIDMLDTFAHVRDIESLRLAWHDVHPNVRGHEIIANNLYDKLRRQPDAWAALMGSEAP